MRLFWLEPHGRRTDMQEDCHRLASPLRIVAHLDLRELPPYATTAIWRRGNVDRDRTRSRMTSNRYDYQQFPGFLQCSTRQQSSRDRKGSAPPQLLCLRWAC